MSSLVFPILPAVQPGQSAGSSYATKNLISVSGKRISVSWRATPIKRIRFSVQLRAWKQAPSPWAAYTEPGLLEYFFDTHRGSWDSFLLDNSTGLYIPGGVSQPRVRFASDDYPGVEEKPGLWTADVELETVL